MNNQRDFTCSNFLPNPRISTVDQCYRSYWSSKYIYLVLSVTYIGSISIKNRHGCNKTIFPLKSTRISVWVHLPIEVTQFDAHKRKRLILNKRTTNSTERVNETPEEIPRVLLPSVVALPWLGMSVGSGKNNTKKNNNKIALMLDRNSRNCNFAIQELNA